MVNFTLGPIVDATNRPSFYGGYDFPPLTLGGFGSFDYLPIPPPPIGWYPSLLWRSPLSRWGDEYLAYDVFDAGSRLLNWGNIWQAEPEYHPYVWNALMWQNYFPQLPPMPQFFNPWPAYSYQPQGVSVIGTPMPKSEPPPAEKKEEENDSKMENGGVDQTRIRSGVKKGRPTKKEIMDIGNGAVVYDENQLHPIKLENLPREWHQSVLTLLQQQDGNLVGIKNKNGVFWIAPSGGEVFRLSQRGDQLQLVPAGSFRNNKLYLSQ